MTLDEFLDDHVPRVLRPLGWELVQFASDGRKAVRHGDCCPLTAAAGAPSDFYHMCGDELGLSRYDGERIVAAADELDEDSLYDPLVRARLLAGLGLSEPA